MNKELQTKIESAENLITQAKLDLKNWANQISKYHKTLKNLTSQINSIKSQITMKNPLNKNQSSTSEKSNPK